MLFDFCGALISLLSTYYFIRLDLKAWPMGLLATCLNGWLYWQKGIYADMCLELFYCLSLCYGWYRWSSLGPKKSLKPRYLSNKQWCQLGVTILGIYSLIFSLLSLSHSTVATLDALTTSLSIVAQWLMCHKIIATWVLWFIADALYAVMYLNKALPFHASLMILYTGFAVVGYMHWQGYKKAFSPLLNPIADAPRV